MGPPTPSISSSKPGEGRIRELESGTRSSNLSPAAFAANITAQSERDADRRKDSLVGDTVKLSHRGNKS